MFSVAPGFQGSQTDPFPPDLGNLRLEGPGSVAPPCHSASFCRWHFDLGSCWGEPDCLHFCLPPGPYLGLDAGIPAGDKAPAGAVLLFGVQLHPSRPCPSPGSQSQPSRLYGTFHSWRVPIHHISLSDFLTSLSGHRDTPSWHPGCCKEERARWTPGSFDHSEDRWRLLTTGPELGLGFTCIFFMSLQQPHWQRPPASQGWDVRRRVA